MSDEQEFNVLLYNNVYNINKFMKNHPGGTNLLQNFEGKDIMNQMERYGHNEYAYRLLEDYKIRQAKNGMNGLNGTNGFKNGTNGYHNGNGIVKNGTNGVNGINGINGKNGMNGTKSPELDEKYEKIVERLKEIQKIEDMVDWSKPMLAQLKNLGPHYNTWIDCPVDRTVRMFDSQFLENFTFAPWYAVLIYWTPISIFLLWHTYTTYVACGDTCTESKLTNMQYAFHIACGVVLWTILEYLIHRFIFHAKPESSILFKQVHFVIHGLHHKTPFDRYRQVFPPIPASFVTYGLHSLLYNLVPYPKIVVTGGIIGYLIYDMIHFYLHHGAPVDGTFLYIMKRYHANHHFVNPDKGYGITSKVWDTVFDTKIKMKNLGFSLSWK